MSAHRAPEKETVAPPPQNPGQALLGARPAAQQLSEAGADALVVRVGRAGSRWRGAGAGAPALPAGPRRAQGTKEHVESVMEGSRPQVLRCLTAAVMQRP